MKIKCLIIDDEPLAINVIKKHLTSFENFELVATHTNAVDAYNTLSQTAIDVIFIDINMPKINGIDFLKNLTNPPMTIITTAYREYAVEGFELNVLDYLVKPISFQRFLKAISKVNDELSKNTAHDNSSPNPNEFAFFKVDKKMVKVFFKDILYIESLKDYVKIKTIYEDFITHKNLISITKVLPMDKFTRIHKSYIISVNQVESVVGNTVQITGKSIPIGRNYQKEAKLTILGNEG